MNQLQNAMGMAHMSKTSCMCKRRLMDPCWELTTSSCILRERGTWHAEQARPHSCICPCKSACIGLMSHLAVPLRANQLGFCLKHSAAKPSSCILPVCRSAYSSYVKKSSAMHGRICSVWKLIDFSLILVCVLRPAFSCSATVQLIVSLCVAGV